MLCLYELQTTKEKLTMKTWIQKNGRTIGGVCGIVGAFAMGFDLKLFGLALAACALTLVVSAERLKNH